MSRYKIPSVDPTLDIVVGWDAPLDTFFGNVIRPVADDAPLELDDEIIAVFGNHYQDVTTVDRLQRQMREYAVIPSDIFDRLVEDSCVSYSPSPIQEFIRRLSING